MAHLPHHHPPVYTFPRAASTFPWLNNQEADPARDETSLSHSLNSVALARGVLVENERLCKSPLIGINSSKASML